MVDFVYEINDKNSPTRKSRFIERYCFSLKHTRIPEKLKCSLITRRVNKIGMTSQKWFWEMQPIIKMPIHWNGTHLFCLSQQAKLKIRSTQDEQNSVGTFTDSNIFLSVYSNATLLNNNIL